MTKRFFLVTEKRIIKMYDERYHLQEINCYSFPVNVYNTVEEVIEGEKKSDIHDGEIIEGEIDTEVIEDRKNKREWVVTRDFEKITGFVPGWEALNGKVEITPLD